MRLFNWSVYSINGAVADGSVFAENDEDALKKVKQKYPNEYLKCTIDEGEEEGMEEDIDIKGLYIRWED